MTALASIISAGLLVWLVFFAYQTYRVDKLRQDLFAIRDALFDEALTEKISFDSEVYVVARQVTNGMIRFGHRLNALSMLILGVLQVRESMRVPRMHIDEILARASDSEKEIFVKFMNAVNLRVAKHVLSSPIFIVTALVPLAMLILTRLGIDVAAGFLKVMKQSFSFVDRAAYSEAEASKFV